MNLRTNSNCEESMCEEIKKHEKQIAGLTRSINVTLFYEEESNIVTGTEINCNVINGILSARKYDMQRAY